MAKIEDIVSDEVLTSFSTETPGEQATEPRTPRILNVPGAAVGRRKEAIARARLTPGSGTFTVNGRSLEEYFPNKLHQQIVKEPLVLVEKTERFDIFANLKGGGTAGQAGALRLAIARALVELDSAETVKPILRLIDALDEHDDVQDVYANFDIPESVLATLDA